MFLEVIVNDLTSIKKIEFLKSVGCMEKAHSGRDLYTHLERTRKELEKLGAPKYLQDAGLFHSVYGTTAFMSEDGLVSFNDRDKIVELIGKQAEEIVWWFCMLEKPRNYNIEKLEDGQLKNDLRLLSYANEVDQMPENNRLEYYNNV